METDKHNIPKRLAIYRHKLGKSQEEMSKELGVNQENMLSKCVMELPVM